MTTTLDHIRELWPRRQHNANFPYDSGIYVIRNLDTGRCYIGSAVTLSGRRADHFRRLSLGTHENKHLQRSWNKRGSDKFVFQVLLYCDRTMTLFYEQRALDFYKTQWREALYNIDLIAGSRLGRPHTPETKAKVSASKKGKISPLALAVLLERNKARAGRKASSETRARMRAAWTPEKREAARLRMLGKKLSPETVAKQRARLMGNTYTLGYRHSEESKQRMKEAQARIAERKKNAKHANENSRTLAAVTNDRS